MRREFYALRKQTGRYTTIDETKHNEIEAPENVELEILKKANAALIMEAMNAIQEVFRIPLALFYFEDFSYREIAKILEVAEGTVMSRLSRGRTELRNWLSSHLDSESLPGNVIPLRRVSGE